MIVIKVQREREGAQGFNEEVQKREDEFSSLRRCKFYFHSEKCTLAPSSEARLYSAHASQRAQCPHHLLGLD